MLQRVRNSFAIKVISILLLLIFVFQIANPPALFAITHGPSQPEYDDFTPAGASDMVNLFTGDFSYNIPLMNVPGPNGGYPINIGYNAGIGMEQEASWVGLGWNLNPGSINRNMRGIPDDFKGDKIHNELYMKPNVTIGVGVRTMFPEIFGGDSKKISGNLSLDYQFYWNNYRGTGHTLGVGISATVGGSGKYNASLGLGLTVSSSDGATISPSISAGYRAQEANGSISFGLTYSSRQGLTDIGIKPSVGITYTSHKEGSPTAMTNLNTEVGINFSSNGNVPNLSTDYNGMSGIFSFSYQSGPTDAETPVPTFTGQFSTSWLDDKSIRADVSAYGYNYSGEREKLAGNDERAIYDFSKEKDYPVHPKVPNLPVPQFNHDQLFVSGHGVTGTFRAYRSDHGLLYDPTSESDYGGFNLGAEIGKTESATKVGVNIGGMYSHGYSGKWRDGLDNFGHLQKFKTDDDILALGETYSRVRPYHYQFNSEVNIVGTDFFEPIRGEGATDIRFSPAFDDITSTIGSNLGTTNTGNGGQLNVVAQLSQSGISTSSPFLKKEFKTKKAIEYFTRAEKSNYLDFNETTKVKHIYKLGEYPLITTSYTTAPQTISQSSSSLNTGGSGLNIGHHTGEYTIQNEDGIKYTYGLPSYNISQEMITFALPESRDLGLNYKDSTLYSPGNDDKIENENGNDHFYNSQKIPHYATTYLLTEIKGPDYVDLTGNGISDDDLGYFVKFNYSPLTVSGNYYGWRMPYKENTAYYDPGFLEYRKDSKGSITFGEKEIWYLNSIETKTHISVFRVTDRADGLGVTNKAGTPEQNLKLKKLDKIDLYSKKDIEANGSSVVPIKSVCFEYSYDLCGNVHNNIAYQSGSYTSDYNHPHKCFIGASPQKSNNDNKGKLTLKKIYFTYGTNLKGKSTPYYFDYYERTEGSCTIDKNNNPDYKLGQADRWGTYKSDQLMDPLDRLKNSENPYVDQKQENKDILDKQVAAWSLREITSPTGSVTKINYETDDYSHVQDQVAGQMCEIIGTGSSSTDRYFFQNASNVTEELPLYKSDGSPHTRIYFKPEYPLPSNSTLADAECEKYISGLNSNLLYFKSFIKLGVPKNLSEKFISDYVDGYCMILRCSSEVVTNGSDIMGFNSNDQIYSNVPTGSLDFNRVPYIELAPTNPFHIFSLTGYQYMKVKRPDILSEDYGAATLTPVGIFASILSIIESIIELFAGFNTTQLFKGHCKFLKEERPSYLRLTSPDNRKYGGGHRVKSIEVNDNWNGVGGTSTYGQKYFYHMENGESSGTAAYEPLTGGNEISLRKPHFYSDNMLQNNPYNYVEHPFGESFYPGASVGYRRVLIEDLNLGKTINSNDGVSRNNTGITEYCFYTAKEFPVITEKTDQVVDAAKSHVVFPVPLIGMFSFKFDNFSQGYKIELNSMHGQLKSVTTYDADYDKIEGDGLWDVANPDYTNKVTYTYKTTAPFSADTKNRLDNKVEVLLADGIKEEALMGVNFDFYTHMEQNTNYSIMAGVDLNALLVANYIPIPSMFPSIELTYNEAKIMVTNKIIYKQGILSKVENFSEGTVATTENLLWDGTNGNVLLSRTSTEFNDHTNYGTANESSNDYIYNYDLPAHWAYTEMQGNYTNYRSLFKLNRHPQGSSTSYSNNYVLDPVSSTGSPQLLNGDIIMICKKVGNEIVPVGNETCYWISDAYFETGSVSVTPGFTFKLNRKNGTYIDMCTLQPIAGGSCASPVQLYAKVITPVRTNQSSVMAGNIVTLQDPVANRTSPFITAYNSTVPYSSMGCPTPLGSFTENSTTKYFCFQTCTGNYFYGRKKIITENGITYLSIVIDSDLNAVGNAETRTPCTNLRMKLPAGTTTFHPLIKLGKNEAWFTNPVTNEIYTLTLIPSWGFQNGDVMKFIKGTNGCATGDCLDGVLDASAVDFADNFSYNYTDHERIGTSFTSNANKYRTGMLGIWRAKQRSLYMVARKQKGDATSSPTPAFKSYTGKDGTYEHFTTYIWERAENGGPFAQSPWRFLSMYTRYSPYGHTLEAQNALYQYSSTLYGYSESLPTAVASNAAYVEIGYDGFEDYGIGSTPSYTTTNSDFLNNGHLPIQKSTSTIDLTLTSGTGHTGNYSLFMNLKSTSNYAYIPAKLVSAATDLSSLNNSSVITLVNNKKYYISFWVKKNRADINFSSAATVPGVYICNSITLPTGCSSIKLKNTTEEVDGWYKIEGEFTTPVTGANLYIYPWPGVVSSSVASAYFDDIRIQPFDSDMNTYVYDYKRLYKTAELDANNYATFYVYDEEGSLVQVKKETEKGVYTIQQNRSNIKTQ